MSEWISIEDRLPTHADGKVLIFTAYGISIARRTINNRWQGDCAIPKLITHWMPLPLPPQKDKPMNDNCVHYGEEFDCCKLLSDFGQPMPVIQPCVESPCPHYKRKEQNR